MAYLLWPGLIFRGIVLLCLLGVVRDGPLALAELLRLVGRVGGLGLGRHGEDL